ncbi:hypothetical protein CERSUDRAFT_109848 [Gelatoporia subvermispora B]|uniref:Uncharacterized protein n=1 Tax=Ceriporiopsis subvermispora (strain B) TaxID=914234 RepID=M2QVU1_CERS8|nr:hypothetical protein CERSUDRAFT_109848 [Gelatoporia subvermispora B]
MSQIGDLPGGPVSMLQEREVLLAACTGACALIFYDHLLTIRPTFAHIYSRTRIRNVTPVTILFTVNRLALLFFAATMLYMLFGFGYVPSSASFSSSTPTSPSPLAPPAVTWTSPGCTVALNVWGGCGIVLTLTRAAFASLRIHAVTAGIWGLPFLVLGLSVASISSQVYTLVLSKPVVASIVPNTLSTWGQTPRRFCAFMALNNSWSESTQKRLDTLNLICTVSAACADMIVVLATWRKTYASVRLSRQTRRRRLEFGLGGRSLSGILIRDGAFSTRSFTKVSESATVAGTFHFMILALLPIATYLYSIATLTTVAGEIVLSILTAFQVPLLAITVSRFLLNLRGAAAHSGCSSSASTTPSFFELSFVSTRPGLRGPWLGSVVQEMGGSLEFAGDREHLDTAMSADADGDEE